MNQDSQITLRKQNAQDFGELRWRKKIIVSSDSHHETEDIL